MARVVLCLAVVALGICLATAQTEPAAAAAVTPAVTPAVAPKAAPAAKPKAATLPTNAQGGLEKQLQDAVQRAAEQASLAVVTKGGTQAQANAAAAAASKKVLDSAREGKGIPSSATNLTPAMQKAVSDAAGKAAVAIVSKGGSQADANAAGAAAAQAKLKELGFSG